MSGLMFNLIAAIILTGCTPPGVDAMFEGKSQLEKKQFKAAIVSFKEAVRVMPGWASASKQARAWNYLGLAYHKDGQFSEARNAYNEAYNKDNNLAEAVFNIGSLRLETGVYDDAIHWFKTYQMLRPKSGVALPNLALAHLSQGELNEAQSIYELLLRQNPNDPKALNGMGLIQERKGNYREAYNYFHTVLEREPDFTPGIWNQGMIAYPALQRPDLAVNKMRRFVYKAPSSPLAPIAKSMAEDIEERLFKQARPVEVIPSTPTEEEKEQQISDVATEETKEGSTEEEQTTQTPPNLASSEQNNLKQSSDPKESSQEKAADQTEKELKTSHVVEPVTEKITSSDPKEDPSNELPEKISTPPAQTTTQTNAVVKVESDVNEPSEEKEDEPRTFSQQSTKEEENKGPSIVAPSDPGVTPLPLGRTFKPYRYLLPGAPVPGNRQAAAPLFERANRAILRSDYEEAITYYEKATSADPAFFDAYFNIGWAALKGGNADKALPAYEYALAIKPDHRDSRYNLALGLIQKDHLRDAARELETLLKANSEDRQVLMRLGELYSGPLHRPVRTREIYQQLLKAGPTPDEVSIARRWLRSNP